MQKTREASVRISKQKSRKNVNVEPEVFKIVHEEIILYPEKMDSSEIRMTKFVEVDKPFLFLEPRSGLVIVRYLQQDAVRVGNRIFVNKDSRPLTPYFNAIVSNDGCRMPSWGYKEMFTSVRGFIEDVLRKKRWNVLEENGFPFDKYFNQFMKNDEFKSFAWNQEYFSKLIEKYRQDRGFSRLHAVK